MSGTTLEKLKTVVQVKRSDVEIVRVINLLKKTMVRAIIGPNPPSDPRLGDLWYNTNNNRWYIYVLE